MNPKLSDLLNNLDLAEVQQRIKETGIKSWDIDSIVERVLLACDLWLLNDLKAGTILVEQEYDLVSKGILDLVLIHDKDGATGIVDWKSTKNVKRPNFIEETKASFQTSLYLAHGGDWLEREYGVRPTYIEYRALDEDGEYRSFRVEVEPWTHKSADTQVVSVYTSYLELANSPSWPQNRRACFVGSKAGPTCPFYKDCTEMTMPTTPTEFDLAWDLRPRSKSSMQAFIECPERFRRTKILGEGEFPASDAILAGEAFHAGLESIYTQAIKLR